MTRLAGFMALMVTFASLSAVAPRASAALEGRERTRVVMLGTGTPAPDPERWGPSIAIVVDAESYIVDAGVGVVRQFVSAQSLLPGNVDWSGVAFITHLHSDHTLGYPDLVLTPWTMRWLQQPLQVYGPKGLRSMTDHVLAAWSEDIDVRTGAGGDLAGMPPPRVDVHEIQPGVIYQDSLVEVTAFAVHHGTWGEAFGYRIRTPDKTVVISGDAGPPSTVAEQCDRCDILVHEGGRPSAQAGPYYRAFHTTAEEVAEIANRCRPRLLVLVHQNPANSSGLAIIRSRYSGPVVIANDLDVF